MPTLNASRIFSNVPAIETPKGRIGIQVNNRWQSSTLRPCLAQSHQRLLDPKYHPTWFQDPFYTVSSSHVSSDSTHFFTSRSTFYRHGNSSSSQQECYRVCPKKFYWLSFTAIHYPQEDRRSEASTQPQTVKQVCTTTPFQDGNNEASVHVNPTRRLPYKYRPYRRIPTRADSSIFPSVPAIRMEKPGSSMAHSSIRIGSEPICIHQGASSGATMGKTQRYTDNRLPRRFVNHCERLPHVTASYSNGPGQASRLGFQYQDGQIFPHSIPAAGTFGVHYQYSAHATPSSSQQDPRLTSRSFSNAQQGFLSHQASRIFYWQSPKSLNGGLSSKTQDSTSSGVEKSYNTASQGLAQVGGTSSSSTARTGMVARQLEDMEWEEFSSTTSGSGAVHGCIRSRLGHRDTESHVAGSVEHQGSTTAYQLEGIDGHLESDSSSQISRQMPTDILRQYDDNSICEQVWGHTFTAIDGFSQQHMELLSHDQHTHSTALYPISLQSSGFTFSTSTTPDRVATCSPLLPASEPALGTSSRGSICFSSQSSTAQVCELEMGSISHGNGCNESGLEQPRSAVHLSSMESPSIDHPTSQGSTSASNVNHTMVALSNMVSNTSSNVNMSPSEDSSFSGVTTSGSRSKRSAQESSLESDGLARKRQRLIDMGASTAAQDIILNPVSVKRHKKYSFIQLRFIQWCEQQDLDPFQPSTSNLINFLAAGHQERQWQSGTILSYRTALLQLFDDPSIITRDPIYLAFCQGVNEQVIKPAQHTPVNIEPILQHFHQLGPNMDMPMIDLTAKLCWLLGICGFLRPADIERIDLDLCSFHESSTSITLQIKGPKERRHGSRITRSVVINQHPSPLLCPVRAFLAYHQRIAHIPCRRTHPVIPGETLNALIRRHNNPLHAITAQRIGKHIRKVMDLLPNSASVKARALGATRALQAGASVDDVVCHGGWSSREIFETFYRINKETHSQVSDLALGSSSTEVSDSLESQ